MHSLYLLKESQLNNSLPSFSASSFATHNYDWLHAAVVCAGGRNSGGSACTSSWLKAYFGWPVFASQLRKRTPRGPRNSSSKICTREVSRTPSRSANLVTSRVSKTDDLSFALLQLVVRAPFKRRAM